ncbi:MAG: YbjN domain-containing protein [Hyphomonadaceae bacterium]
MSLDLSSPLSTLADPLDVIEQALAVTGWAHERDEDETIQCVVPTRWGDMGGLFAFRVEPPAVHFSVTLDVKPQTRKRADIAELVLMVNERLWLGHFDYWAEDGVLLYRHALPMLGRDEPSSGEIQALMTAAAEAIDRFVPAFNFILWAGKTPREALEGALFETKGEA